MSDFIPLTQEEKDRDGYHGYFVAIAELRRQGIVAGTIEPLNEEERRAAHANVQIPAVGQRQADT